MSIHRSTRWARANPEKARAKQRRYVESHREEILARRRLAHNAEAQLRRGREWKTLNPARHLFNTAKRRARAYGIPFQITLEDVVVPECCPVLGINLEWSSGRRGGGMTSPSLDRIVPSLGYVKGNVAVISWRANCIKRDATATELRAIATWLDHARGQ